MPKTDRAIRKVNPSSDAVSGSVRKTVPPIYTNTSCIISIIGIIIIKGLFLLIPAKMLSRSERELKQLKIDAKINRAKNAVSRQRLSASVRKRDTIDGLFKNAIKSATVENPVKNT